MNENGINFKIDMPLANCPYIYSDPDRIEQILYILLDNAMKFTSRGGNISILSKQENNKFYLMIKDTGAGISNEDQKHIFERFYKADKSRKSRGTGLGLSIAKEIMDRLDETLEVESVIGQGSTFILSLTIANENMIWEEEKDEQ